MGATDKALDEFIVRCGANKAGLKSKHMPEQANLVRFPFSSTRKRMSTIIENATGKGGYDKRIMLKGASEIVLISSTFEFKKLKKRSARISGMSFLRGKYNFIGVYSLNRRINIDRGMSQKFPNLPIILARPRRIA
jgi:magnesium-transporting ATPase (P-type)